VGHSTPKLNATLVYFKESLHIIIRELFLSEKLFGRASPGFNIESALGALLNRTFR
jgi:hypothetical protein